MPFVDFIAGQLQRLGLGVERVVNDNLITTAVEFNGTPETLILTAIGKNPADQTIVKIVSEGISLTGDEAVDGPMSIFLLRRHAQMTLARWEVMELDDGGAHFILASTLIANTMDASELHEAMRSILVERHAVLKELQKYSIDF